MSWWRSRDEDVVRALGRGVGSLLCELGVRHWDDSEAQPDAARDPSSWKKQKLPSNANSRAVLERLLAEVHAYTETRVRLCMTLREHRRSKLSGAMDMLFGHGS